MGMRWPFKGGTERMRGAGEEPGGRQEGWGPGWRQRCLLLRRAGMQRSADRLHLLRLLLSPGIHTSALARALSVDSSRRRGRSLRTCARIRTPSFALLGPREP